MTWQISSLSLQLNQNLFLIKLDVWGISALHEWEIRWVQGLIVQRLFFEVTRLSGDGDCLEGDQKFCEYPESTFYCSILLGGKAQVQLGWFVRSGMCAFGMEDQKYKRIKLPQLWSLWSFFTFCKVRVRLNNNRLLWFQIIMYTWWPYIHWDIAQSHTALWSGTAGAVNSEINCECQSHPSAE